MWFDILLEVWVATVLPVLLGPKLCIGPFLLPMGNEQVLILPRLGIVDFWKVPLIGVRARNAEIQEAFFRRLGDPVHAVVDADLCLVLSSAVIDAESYPLKLLILFVAALVLRLLPRSVIFDELWFEELIHLLLLLLPLLRLLVVIVVLPGAAYVVLVAANIALRILQLLFRLYRHRTGGLASSRVLIIMIECFWLYS